MNNPHYFLLGRNDLWICQKLLFRLKYNAFYSLVTIFLYLHLIWRKTHKTQTFELIKSIENNVKSLSNTSVLDFRNRAIFVIQKIGLTKPPNHFINKKLTFLLRITKRFIRENPKILFTRADKGNVTAIDQEYKQKMRKLLGDISLSCTYIVINRDPIRKLTESVRILLTKWKNCGYIDSKMYKKLYCSNGILPRAYGASQDSQRWVLFEKLFRLLIILFIHWPLFYII